MKKSCLGKLLHYLPVILFFLSSLLASGQQSFYDVKNWRFANPRQFGFSVTDIDFADNNKGVAVGASGGIAYTTDGGTTWSYANFSFMNAAGLQVSTSFSDVHFVSSNTVYAVGSGGCMAKSVDGGANWTFVRTPLYNNARRINTTWFVNDNKGYIGGEWNTLDSIPKVYVTLNGGASWDSLTSPSGGTVTRIGYINNPNVAPQLHNVTGKTKEIYRIIFLDDNTGYISGSSQHSSGGPAIQIPAVNTTTCLPTGGQTSSLGAQQASLVWKYSNGTLSDYSVTKERTGYPGSPLTGPIPCSGTAGLYRIVNSATATFSAMNVINDSIVLLISLGNNLVMRVYTGRNDSTLNVATGLKERGRYELLNFTNSPTGYPTIPAVNPIFSFSGPTNIARAANGKLLVPVNSPVLFPVNRLMTSVDTGRTWVSERFLPTGRNYSEYGGQAIDILPSGKVVVSGQNGVVSDSIPGGRWNSNYVMDAVGSFNKIDFADCNNGMAAGSAFIAITNNAGKTWTEVRRSDFAALNISINAGTYVPGNPTTAYFATSTGTIYKSTNINSPAAVMDPMYADPLDQAWDVATVGNDSVWACGYSGFSVPTANRVPKVYRSFNGGLTWSVYSNFGVGSLFQNFRHIEFPTRTVGYVSGTRDTIWKTTDAGVTWTKLPLPFPGVTPQITYNDMFALDANTLFLVGNGFPRKVIIRSLDGGNTWQDITGNALTIFPVGNFNSVVFHDANNGYVGCAGGFLVTNNGGATWRIDYPASGSNQASMAFAPKKVPAGISFVNRKLFTVTAFNNNILEYGDKANVDVNSTQTVVNASCTNPSGGSVTVTATGGLAPYTYSIDGGAYQASNTFTGLTQGVKTITIKDAFCGTLTKTVTVGFNDNMTISSTPAIDTLVCAGSPVTLLAATNGTGSTFAWTPAGGLSAANISNPVATVTNNSTTYTVTATLNGCVRSKSVTVRTKPNPFISAGPDKTIVEGEDAFLEGGGPANAQQITWTPAGTLTSANTYAPLAKPVTTTTYTLTVRDANSCTSSDNMVLNVIPYCLKVMDAFTPNGDGQNDTWVVTNNGGSCTKQVYATVFNRYGNIVFKDDHYQNKWDGTYNGKPVADGTYYYVITYRLINNTTITLKGDVTILR